MSFTIFPAKSSSFFFAKEIICFRFRLFSKHYYVNVSILSALNMHLLFISILKLLIVQSQRSVGTQRESLSARTVARRWPSQDTNRFLVVVPTRSLVFFPIFLDIFQDIIRIHAWRIPKKGLVNNNYSIFFLLSYPVPSNKIIALISVDVLCKAKKQDRLSKIKRVFVQKNPFFALHNNNKSRLSQHESSSKR